MGTKLITLEGGFHNSDSIQVKIKTEYLDRIETASDCRQFVSEQVEKKLDKHFCGIKGCKCGGFARAELIK